MQIKREPFGVTENEERVDRFTVHNSAGMSFSLITYGATITSVQTPDAAGRIEEITLGFDTLSSYEEPHPWLGAALGRYANRIKSARFDLQGKTVYLDRNEGEHHLHGGSRGFSRKVWEAFPIKKNKEAGVALTLTSPAGDQGYPGTLEVRLTVMLSEENELSFAYEAKTDEPTPVSLGNHVYWNLRGECSGPVYDHEVYINSSHYLETDSQLLPTGRILPVDNTPLDFRKPKPAGVEIAAEVLEKTGGWDHCYTLSEENALSIPAAEVHEPGSGRSLTVFTISPAIQFYTANTLQGFVTRCGKADAHGAFCLEPQEYPDSVNHRTFPDAVLQPGNRYLRKTVYLFSAQGNTITGGAHER